MCLCVCKCLYWHNVFTYNACCIIISNLVKYIIRQLRDLCKKMGGRRVGGGGDDNIPCHGGKGDSTGMQVRTV